MHGELALFGRGTGSLEGAVMAGAVGAGFGRRPGILGVSKCLLLPAAAAFGLAIDDAIRLAIVLSRASTKLGEPPRRGKPSRMFIRIGHFGLSPLTKKTPWNSMFFESMGLSDVEVTRAYDRNRSNLVSWSRSYWQA